MMIKPHTNARRSVMGEAEKLQFDSVGIDDSIIS